MPGDAGFGGRIGDDWRDSEPWWPPVPEAPAGAPNVILVVLDDVGFAQLGCYGSDMATPALDRLAATGVRLANFHTTALCSPTRACLLTGRNHHRNGMGRVADLAVGFPGYWGNPPKENGFLGEILRTRGYASYAVGKWHLTPEDETHMAAPRSTWPLGRGFDRWYGFHGGETHQFAPALYHDNHSVRPARTIEDGYHLSEDLADRAIEFVSDLRAVDADQPFFLYFATGACHSPHHAPVEWRERYTGAFDDGWDAWRERTHARQLELGIVPPGTVLSPRPSWVPAWDSLDERQREVAARFMECFAGFLSHTDHQVGRLVEFVERLGELDDTVIMVVSDNGASAEGGSEGSINDVRLSNLDPAGRSEMYERIGEIGGPLTHNNYPWGWTMAGNTPFKRWKREVHQGGVADPCIVSWPAQAGRRARGRSATSSPTPSTCCRPCSSWPGWRHRPRSSRSANRRSTGSASPTCSVPAERGSRAPRHPALRDVRVPGHLPPTAGRRSPSTRSGPSTTTGSTQTPPSTTTCGSSTTWPRTSRRSRDLAGEHPERVAEMVALVGRGPAEPGPPTGQPGAVGARPPQAGPPPATDAVPVLPGAAPGARAGGGQRAEPLTRHHRGRGRSDRDRSPRECCWPSAVPSADGPCMCSTGDSATCTTSTARSASHRGRPSARAG